MSITSQLTGLSRGRFHELEIRDSSGAFQDVLSLIAAGSGGGAGAVSSAQTPLSISGGVLSIDLSGYTDSAALTTLLSNKLDSLAGAGGIVVTGSGTSRTLTIDLSPYVETATLFSGNSLRLQDSSGVFRNLGASATGSLVYGGAGLAFAQDTVSPASLTSTLASYLNVQAPLQLTGTSTVRVLESLWKPSNVTLGLGLIGLGTDATGYLSIGLTGAESRTALKLADSQGTVRDLASTTAGALTWDGGPVATETHVTSQLAGKQDLIPQLSVGTVVLAPAHILSGSYFVAGTWTTVGSTHSSLMGNY